MKTLNKIAILFVLVGAVAFAQTAITSTTLSAAVSSATSDAFNVTSATGFTAGNFAFVDRELVQIKSVSGTRVNVIRGISGGGPAVPHASGATIYTAAPGEWFNADPSGSCTATDYATLPTVSIPTGNLVNCVSSSWVITARGPAPFRFTDGFAWIPPGECWMTPATTAFSTGPALVRAAAANVVLSGTTNTTAGTITVTCDLAPVMQRLSSGKGVTITDIGLLYGQQTTAMSSIAAAIVRSVTYPAVGAAAAGTVAAAGGSITATPGTLLLTTTTTGQCFTENLSLGTPIPLVTDLTRYTVEQVFTTAGTTATTLQVCGAYVKYTSVPL